MLAVYLDPNLLWTLPCIVAALLLLRSSLSEGAMGANRRYSLSSACALSFTLCSLLLYDDADERGDCLLSLWPLLLILSAALASPCMFRLRRDRSLRPLLPSRPARY